MSQGARPEFHSSLKPSDNFPAGKHLRGCRGHLVELRRAKLVGSQSLLDFRVGKFRAEIRMAERLHRQTSAVVEVRSEHGAQRHTVIRSSRLHKDFVHHP